MAGSEVLVEDRGDHRLVTINRPRRRNALTVTTVTQLADAITGARDSGVRSVVLTGAPPVFCAGGDLPSLAALARQGAMTATDAIYTGFHGLVRAIRDSPLPVIAAVNGAALGAGLDLALCCDLRIAGASARFESTWIKVGLVPGMGGAHHLPHIVGSARAAGMLLLGRPVSAEQALAWGLVNEVVDDDRVVETAAEAAKTIAGLPAAAVARTKAALRRSINATLDAELATLGAQQGQLLTGPDFTAVAERMTAPRDGGAARG